MASPEKRRYDIMLGHPTSPLASKRQRVASSAAAASTSTVQMSIDYDSTTTPDQPPQRATLYAFKDTDDSSMQPKVIEIKATDATTIQDSLSAMVDETHMNRLSLREEMTAGKGTESAYLRHIKNYEKFMIADQAARVQQNPLWTSVPAHPITATKAAAFLQHETTRTKVSCFNLYDPIACLIYITLSSTRPMGKQYLVLGSPPSQSSNALARSKIIAIIAKEVILNIRMTQKLRSLSAMMSGSQHTNVTRT